MIHPSEIMIYRDGGTGDMGDHTDNLSTVARLRDSGHRMAIVFVRVHFNRVTGSGTQVAVMRMIVDSAAGVFFDNELKKWESVGEAYDALLHVTEEHLGHYLVDTDDEIVFEWTNPESGEITWGLEVGYVRADLRG